MRVIEPQHLSSRHKEKPSNKKFVFSAALAVFAISLSIYLVFLADKTQAPSANNGSNNKTTANTDSSAPKSGSLKTFTPQQFRDLYNGFAYPNTERISDKTPITGNEAADNHIRAIAVSRGYTLRSAPVSDTFQTVAPGMLLQQRAAQPWLDLQAAAKKNNLDIGLSAAYRSADEQAQLFASRLSVAAINIERIPSGAYDAQILRVLQSTAVPGYSRHHTGYTVDITCEQTPALSFLITDCFKWLSAENYKNAKTYGWIPSYPEGTGQQGPEPEAWEYVWVGIDAVTE